MLSRKDGGVSWMRIGRGPQEQIDGFIDSLVMDRGSDERTAKAYRLDLELFFRWLEGSEGLLGESRPGEELSETGQAEEGLSEGGQPKEGLSEEGQPGEGLSEEDQAEDDLSRDGRSGYALERAMESYLAHLSGEKGLRFSTICRKHRVFGYYLSYLQDLGILQDISPLEPPEPPKERPVDSFLTKKEVDAFFHAIDREYMALDSDFRRRVCLRDQVMMELLFYHRIEISELLRLEVSDYDRQAAVLKIRRKRERDRTVHLFSHALQEQMMRWLQEHAYFEHGEAYQDRMFLSKLGKPLSMKMVTNIFEKYRVLAGIEKACTPKDLKNGLGRYAEEVVRELG